MPQSLHVLSVVFVGSFLLCATSGCGSSRPDTVPVRGTVTLDGQPVSGAAVLLIPSEGGRPAEGISDEDGSFRLSTFAHGDGALPGQHAVTITLIDPTGGRPADAAGLSPTAPGVTVPTKWTVPKKYSMPTTSGITVEVEQGIEPLTLRLES